MLYKANLESLKKAIELLGSVTKFSLDVGISYQTAMSWKHGRRVPSPLYCLKIETLTEGKVKARDILPDYPWDELSNVRK